MTVLVMEWEGSKEGGGFELGDWVGKGAFAEKGLQEDRQGILGV